MALATRPPVPQLQNCPRVRTIARTVSRSYPTGRQQFSRAFVGEPMDLTVRASEPVAAAVRAALVTTMNGAGHDAQTTVPFERVDDRTFACRVVPDRTGLFWYRAQFSLDAGATWSHDPAPDAWVLVDPPQVDHLRLYTLIPGVSGSMADWAAELPKIRAMGFNAVHLLPLTALDTSRSPYSAKDLFAVDRAYLDPTSTLDGLDQLDAFVEAAAAEGVRLCFDLVLNHVGVDSEIARRAPEWVVPDATSPDGNRRARYWSDQGWQSWHDLVLIDYEHPIPGIRADVWAYMTAYALFWAGYAARTGGFVRFDNLHSSDKRFIDAVTAAIRGRYPNVAVIAEYFTDAGTMLTTVPEWGLNLVLATPWDQKFVPQLREYLKYMHSVSEHVRFFMPVSSHDSGSPAQEFGSVLSTVPRYVAAALLGTGATGVTQGVEWGIERKIEFVGEPKRLMPREPVFAGFLRKVNEILVAEPALRRGANCRFVDGGHHAVIAAFRADGRPGKPGLLVACNFDIGGEHAIEADLTEFLPAGEPVKATDLLTGKEQAFDGPRVRVMLPPCTACVLRF